MGNKNPKTKMTNKQNNKIIKEGREYAPGELEKYQEDLLKPILSEPEHSKDKPFEKAFFLTDDDFGKNIHSKIIAKYSDIEAITKISLGKGSNPFYAVAVNEVLRKEFPQIRTATQADLERILRENLLELNGHYEDSGLVWRSNQDPNNYLAENLFNQFKTKGANLKQNSAYVIYLHNLFLKKDGASPEKISFVLPDSVAGKYFECPILNEISQQFFESSDIDASTGIPKKVSASGSRKLYTRNWDSYSVKNSGLVRLYLCRNLNLNSDNENLSDSNDDGRVVLVSAEGGAS